MKEMNRKETILLFVNGSKRYFALAVLFACFLAVFDLMNPKLIGRAVDVIIGEDSYLKSHIWILAAMIIGFALLGALSRYLFGLMNAIGAEKLVEHTHNLLYEHISYLPFSWFDENQTGDIIQRSTSDVDTIKRFLSEQLTNLIRIVIMLLMAIFFMFRLHVKLALAALVFFPIIVVYSVFFFYRMSEKFLAIDEEEGLLSSMVQENLTGVRVVRAFGRERYEIDRFEKENDHYTSMWIDLMKLLSSFWSSNDFISGLQILTVVSLGAYFCVKGELSAGDYVAFIAYNSMLTFPVRMLGRMVSEMSKAGISIDRLRYIMNSPIEKDAESAVDFPTDAKVEFSHVNFSYDGEHPVLCDVSFAIPEGSSVGIIGRTGSGKSTAALLLDALYDLPEGNGTITIGGVDVRKIRRQEVRRHIGMVLQEPYLFSRTLEDNITIAAENDAEERIREAARQASLLETVEKFAEGFQTQVGERGVTLSGGQKQRTAIAQMLIRDPKIMIFDDSLSAVDAKTDAVIRENIGKASENTTTLLISHRVSTVLGCDRIIAFADGKIVEQGSPEELLQQNGYFRQLYDLQLGKGEAQDEE